MELKIKITNVKKVKLEPGDVMVFNIEEHLPNPYIEKITYELKKNFPEQKILVCGRGITFHKVLRKGEKS